MQYYVVGLDDNAKYTRIISGPYPTKKLAQGSPDRYGSRTIASEKELNRVGVKTNPIKRGKWISGEVMVTKSGSVKFRKR
jgi:hypothetical protein